MSPSRPHLRWDGRKDEWVLTGKGHEQIFQLPNYFRPPKDTTTLGNPDRQIYFQRDHVGTITAGKSLTGLMIAQTFKGTGDSGNLDGAEIKVRGNSTNTDFDVDGMRAIVANCDAKNTDVSGIARCIECIFENSTNSTVAEVRALNVKIQASGTLTANYVCFLEGHSAVYADYGIYIRYVKRPFYAACTPSGATHLKAFEMAITDTTTQSTGWNASFFVELTTSGTKSPTELACGRFNHIIGGTVSGAMIGLKAKIGKSGSPTVTSAIVQGLHVSIDEVGNTSAGAVAGVYIEMYTTSDIDNSFFIWCKHQGSAPKVDSMLGMWGVKPDHFLKCQTNTPNGFWSAGARMETDHLGLIKCKFGNDTGYINVWVS